MSDTDPGEGDLGDRVTSLETGQSRILSRLDELLAGSLHKKAEEHEESKLGRPSSIQEQVAAELKRAEEEKAAQAAKDGEKAERLTLAQRLAKLEEQPPVQPQPRRQRAMWGKR